MKKATLIALAGMMIVATITLAVGTSRTIPTETYKVTEWTVTVTNGTASLTNTSGQPRKLNRVYFTHSGAVTGTGTVDVVKGSATNRIGSVTMTAATSGQFEPAPAHWVFPSDTINVGENNTTTSACVIVVEYEHP